MKIISTILFIFLIVVIGYVAHMLSAMKNKFIQLSVIYNKQLETDSSSALYPLDINFDFRIKHYKLEESDFISSANKNASKQYEDFVNQYFSRKEHLTKIMYLLVLSCIFLSLIYSSFFDIA